MKNDVYIGQRKRVDQDKKWNLLLLLFIKNGDEIVMKKYLTITLILLMLFILFGCSSKKDSLASEQQKAVNNSINYIKNSSFTAKDRINTDIITVKNANEKTWESVWSKGFKVDKNAVDSTDWIITIGDTSNHDFAIIVCDSDTYEVIGHIPLDQNYMLN